MLFDLTGSVGENLKPFTYVLFLGAVVVGSILFWHAALWNMIVPSPAGMTSRSRQAFLRSIDYLWYGIAIISALAAINNLQRRSLSDHVDWLFTENNYERTLEQQNLALLPDACQTVVASTFKGRSSDSKEVMTNARALCRAYNTVQSVRSRGYLRDCMARGFAFGGGDDEDFPTEDGYPVEVGEALDTLQLLCTARTSEIPWTDVQEAIALRDANSVSLLEAHGWYLILAAIIGLRLVKTTADVADALRRR